MKLFITLCVLALALVTVSPCQAGLFFGPNVVVSHHYYGIAPTATYVPVGAVYGASGSVAMRVHPHRAAHHAHKAAKHTGKATYHQTMADYHAGVQ